MVLNEFNSQGTVQGDYRGILAASGDSVETLGANLEWYEKVYKSFGELTPAVSAFQQSMDALHTSMNAQIDKAHELGLSSDRLVDARGREVAKLQEQRDAQLANIKDTLEARAIEAGVRGGNADDNREAVRVRVETRNAAVEFERLKQELTALGLTSQEVTASMTEFRAIQWAEAYNSAEASREARNAAEEARKADDERRRAAGLAVQTDAERARSKRQSALRQGGAGSALGVITNLRSYVSSLSTNGAGSGTAMDRLSATQRQFDAVFGAAAAGDAGSISGLQDAAEGYRAAAREVFGGGQGFADALRLIEQRIGSISNLGADALTASFMADNARANTDRIVDALAGLRRENAALRADLNMLLMRPAA